MCESQQGEESGDALHFEIVDVEKVLLLSDAKGLGVSGEVRVERMCVDQKSVSVDCGLFRRLVLNLRSEAG